MLRQRILTSVIGLPLLIAAIWFENPWFKLPWITIIVAILTALGSIEFYRMSSHNKIHAVAYFGVAIAVLLTIIPYYPYFISYYSNFITKPSILTLAIIISLIWLLFQPKKEGVFNNWAWVMAGILYIGWTLSYWSELRNLEYGREWILCSMLTIMASDSSAFFVGRTWGKHYMTPSISPKKTWEGAIGGLFGSIIVFIILGIVFSLPLNYWQLALLGCVISILAQLGDLVESLLKRNTSVKDSGNLMPGHGGILDRIDSFIFTGILIYYCVLATAI